MKFINKKRREVQQITPTVELLQEMFAECNHLYFCDSLKPISIITFESNDNYGEFRCNLNEKNACLDNLQIAINISKPRTKSEYEATLIHEMIHYKVMSNLSSTTIKKSLWHKRNGDSELADKILYQGNYAHTNEWKTLAEDINRVYKLNIHLR